MIAKARTSMAVYTSTSAPLVTSNVMLSLWSNQYIACMMCEPRSASLLPFEPHEQIDNYHHSISAVEMTLDTCLRRVGSPAVSLKPVGPWRGVISRLGKHCERHYRGP
jgi:hypothetical protein